MLLWPPSNEAVSKVGKQYEQLNQELVLRFTDNLAKGEQAPGSD
jgi:hypothetical protein